MKNKLNVAIIGSGNIGTDLLIKVLRSSYLECKLFIGRNLSSRGMSKAVSLGVPVSDASINAITKNPDCCDLVFDATSAYSHMHHATILKELNKIAIDMTPAKIGQFCIPALNLEECLEHDNINMVTCGGQSSVPLAYAIGKTHTKVEYIEVVSTIASRSAGPGTRINIDEYIETTEKAIKQFSNCAESKVILNLNPAEPCIDMRTTVFAKVDEPDMERLTKEVTKMVAKINAYVPGYELIIPPTCENGRITISVKVKGNGDYLPSYAGNLDIINSAAISAAEEFAKSRLKGRL